MAPPSSFLLFPLAFSSERSIRLWIVRSSRAACSASLRKDAVSLVWVVDLAMELSGRMIRFFNRNFSGGDGVPARLAHGFSSKFEIAAMSRASFRYPAWRCSGLLPGMAQPSDHVVRRIAQYARDVGS